MNADLSLLAMFIGSLTFSLSAAWGYATWRERRNQPETIEQQLRQQVKDLVATVRILQADHVDDVERFELLEQRQQDFEHKAELRQLDYERVIFEQTMKIRYLEAELAHYRNVLPSKVAYRPNKLEAGDLKTLRLALLDCYTSRSQWRTLLGDINRNLDQVATGDNLQDIAASVLQAANDEGWLPTLLTEAAAGRMNVVALRELVTEFTTSLGM